MRMLLVAIFLTSCIAPAPEPVIDEPRAEQPAPAPAASAEEPIAEPTTEKTEPSVPVAVAPTEADIVIFEMIEFPTGSSEVSEAARSILDTVAGNMTEHPDFILLEVAGYARHGVEHNALAISQARSKRIVAELVRRGVAKERLIATAYADHCPLHTEATGEARDAGVRFKMLLTDEGPTGLNHGCQAATDAGLPPPEVKAPAK